MKGSVIALEQIKGREAAAHLVDGRLEDLLIAPGEGVLAPETLCRGKLGRPVKGLGGAFVELPGGARGFLRQVKGLRPGAALLVQVSGLAEPGKAVPLSTRLLFKSRYAIITPEAPGLNISRQISDPVREQELKALATDTMQDADPSLGLILRSACELADDEIVRADIMHMRKLAETVLGDETGPPEILLDAPAPHLAAWRDWPIADTLDEAAGSFRRYGVIETIDALMQSKVMLQGGASMVIEPTRALIAVDVNTGADTSPAAALKANIAAIRELPRQLRLRGLGGQIVIDLAPVSKKDRQILEQSLRAAFRTDGRDTVLAGWTPLGNFELTRKRDRMPLLQLLA